jgi:hypothetical protein
MEVTAAEIDELYEKGEITYMEKEILQQLRINPRLLDRRI